MRTSTHTHKVDNTRAMQTRTKNKQTNKKPLSGLVLKSGSLKNYTLMCSCSDKHEVLFVQPFMIQLDDCHI